MTDMRTLVLGSSLVACYIFALFTVAMLGAGVFGYHVPENAGRQVMWGIVGVVAVHFALMWRRAVNSDTYDVTPDECWKWGLFYYNPNDPAIMVAKRSGPGYTMNFARPVTWIVSAVFFVLMLLPLVFKK